jgi:serine/threonine-protein kinase RsbW
MTPAAAPTPPDDPHAQPQAGPGEERESTMTLRTLAGIAEVQEQLLVEVRRHGYDDSAQFAIRLAVEEALANAVRYGRPEERDAAVRLTYQVTDERVWVRITDPGPGFNPQDVPDPTEAERLDLPTGRGILIMRAFMTEVSYNDKGNVVTLVYEKSTSS